MATTVFGRPNDSGREDSDALRERIEVEQRGALSPDEERVYLVVRIWPDGSRDLEAIFKWRSDAEIMIHAQTRGEEYVIVEEPVL